jgi:hypothetical protein
LDQRIAFPFLSAKKLRQPRNVDGDPRASSRVSSLAWHGDSALVLAIDEGQCPLVGVPDKMKQGAVSSTDHGGGNRRRGCSVIASYCMRHPPLFTGCDNFGRVFAFCAFGAHGGCYAHWCDSIRGRLMAQGQPTSMSSRLRRGGSTLRNQHPITGAKTFRWTSVGHARRT